MRDPFVQRGPDGTFHMVWTWSWRTPTVIGHSTSTDLVHWTPHQHLAVMANEPAALNVWAPALYYDLAQHRWLIFWSSTIPGRFPGDNSGDNGLNHRIFSTTTKDFSTFTPAKVFFDPGFSVIDATLIHAANKYHLVFKDERKTPLQKHLLTAESSTIEGPWTNISEPFSETWSEGAAIIPVKGGYIAYYDHYRDPQHYAAMFSPDLKHWTDATPQTTLPPRPPPRLLPPTHQSRIRPPRRPQALSIVANAGLSGGWRIVAETIRNFSGCQANLPEIPFCGNLAKRR